MLTERELKQIKAALKGMTKTNNAGTSTFQAVSDAVKNIVDLLETYAEEPIKEITPISDNPIKNRLNKAKNEFSRPTTIYTEGELEGDKSEHSIGSILRPKDLI